jgi:hypothetical protein
VIGQRRLFDITAHTAHDLLLFDGMSATKEGYANLASIARHVGERWGDIIRVHVVVPLPTRLISTSTSR